MANEQKNAVPISTNAWEENMIAELAQKHGIAEDKVLDIGITFLMNEIQSAMNNNPCIMAALSTAMTKQAYVDATKKGQSNE